MKAFREVKFKFPFYVVMMFALLGLAACGGSGGGGTAASGGGGGTGTQVSGVAATGKAIADVKVTLVDSKGKTANGTTGTGGSLYN